MDNSTRVQRALDLADEATEEIANGVASGAAEDALQRGETGAKVKEAHDEAYQVAHEMFCASFRRTMLLMLECYVRQPHPASVTAASLAAIVLELPGGQLDAAEREALDSLFTKILGTLTTSTQTRKTETSAFPCRSTACC